MVGWVLCLNPPAEREFCVWSVCSSRAERALSRYPSILQRSRDILVRLSGYSKLEVTMDGCFCVLALQQTGEVCGVCHTFSPMRAHSSPTVSLKWMSRRRLMDDLIFFAFIRHDGTE